MIKIPFIRRAFYIKFCQRQSIIVLKGPLLFYLALLFLFSSARACDCVTPSTATVGLEYADAVFIGSVISIEDYGYGKKSAFRVKQAWKGVPKEFVEIVTGSCTDPCNYKFDIGESYLVYAFKSDELTTNRCLRNQKTEDASNDIAELNSATTLHLPDIILAIGIIVIIMIFIGLSHKKR